MASELLNRMEYLLVGFEVQSVVGSKTRSDRYLGEITAAYVGAGDFYDDSVIYDAVARRFLISSFAAFRAKFSRKYGI